MQIVIGTILSLLTQLLKLGIGLFGEYKIAQWLSYFQLWYRTAVSQELRRHVDDEYRILLLQWEALQKDRKEHIHPNQRDEFVDSENHQDQ